ncbi:MAG: hypothetical protein AAGA54_05250 [Myxococcota bacterium]
MASRPIKLNLGGEEVYLVPSRDLQRWTGYVNARRAAYELVTPDNVRAIRDALFVPPTMRTDEVFDELRKQLEDGSALFFEISPAPVPFEAPEGTDLIDLLPDGGTDGDRTDLGPHSGLHWIEIVCVNEARQGYAGAQARVRLPDGRSEYVTLDARSSVRFDDLTEGGTVHFELSADAEPSGMFGLDPGTDYTLGGAVGLSTRRRHVLRVRPNPDAFVSVELVYDDGEPVLGGQYTLSTKRGDLGGALEGEPARADNLVLPSGATYAFEAVIPPPRPVDEVQPEGGTVEPVVPIPSGTDSSTHTPTQPGAPDVAADTVSVAVMLPDGTPLPATLVFGGARSETVEGDSATLEGVDGPVTLMLSNPVLPPPELA